MSSNVEWKELSVSGVTLQINSLPWCLPTHREILSEMDSGMGYGFIFLRRSYRQTGNRNVVSLDRLA